MWHVCATVAAHLSPPVCCLQDKCHPQTIAVCQSRADGLGLKVLVSSEDDFKFDKDVSGILMQYPATDGAVHDYKVSYCCFCGSFFWWNTSSYWLQSTRFCLQGSKVYLKPLLLKSYGSTEEWGAVRPAVSDP